MSRRYTDEYRATILEQLQANMGSVAITSLQTGVPERTLRDWRRKAGLEGGLPPLPPPPPRFFGGEYS